MVEGGGALLDATSSCNCPRHEEIRAYLAKTRGTHALSLKICPSRDADVNTDHGTDGESLRPRSKWPRFIHLKPSRIVCMVFSDMRYIFA